MFVDCLVEVFKVCVWKFNNYFYYGYIVGEFVFDCCLCYLEKKNFINLKKRVDRVDFFYGIWVDVVVCEGLGLIIIVLLFDFMDWMLVEMIVENILKVVVNMDKEKGCIFWRSFVDCVYFSVFVYFDGILVLDYDCVGWYFM